MPAPSQVTEVSTGLLQDQIRSPGDVVKEEWGISVHPRRQYHHPRGPSTASNPGAGQLTALREIPPASGWDNRFQEKGQPVSLSVSWNACAIRLPISLIPGDEVSAGIYFRTTAKKGCSLGGVTQSSRRPTPEFMAVERVRRIIASCSCRSDALHGTARRVFTSPGTGAFAKTMRWQPGGVTPPWEWLDLNMDESEEVSFERFARVELIAGDLPRGHNKAQAPHQEDGSEEPVFLPATARRDPRSGQAEGTGSFSQEFTHGDVSIRSISGNPPTVSKRSLDTKIP